MSTNPVAPLTDVAAWPPPIDTLMNLTPDGLGADAPRLTVIGTGYLGATHAVAMAALGYRVLGVDVDPQKVRDLSAGQVPFFEPGLPSLLGKAMATGRLSFTDSLQEAAEFGDVHFLCVGTPQRADGLGADLTYVEAALTGLAVHLRRPCVIAGKSTVPVGTARRLAQTVSDLAPVGAAAQLVWNPEFLREGFAVEDTLCPDRLVIGASGGTATELVARVYEPLTDRGCPLIRTDLETAELVKVAANSFLATKISFINAMAEVCEATGADVSVLANALSYDARIGGQFLKPGLGFGGGCLPKDIRAFMARTNELGVGQATAFLREVDDINRRRRRRTVDLVREVAGGDLTDVRVCALGAAFKPNSDDVRDAPALDVARMLVEEGALVSVFDPEAMDNARKVQPTLHYADGVGAAAKGADVVVLLTEWPQFRAIDPELLGHIVKAKRVVDGRHALDARVWSAAGWEYRALGRPTQVA